MLSRFVLLLLAAGTSGTAFADHHETRDQRRHSTVIGTDGQAHGMVMFEQTPAGVLIDVDLEGLPQGEHGFHIHEKGVCDPGEGFKTAGGHFSPANNAHGFKAAKRPHAGDMPNQFVSATGHLRAQVLNPASTLGAGRNTLADADGSALVIHAGADDHASQPSGAAGDRIACAVIFPPKS